MHLGRSGVHIGAGRCWNAPWSLVRVPMFDLEVVHSFDCGHKIIEDLHDCICRGDQWLCDVLVFEVNSVQDAMCV